MALAANVVIAVAKLAAGLLSHSSAMLAESAHSLADSLNEVLLGISMHRARKGADADHPLGHGRERFLWAFLAGMASFLIGGCLSIALAIRSIQVGGETTKALISWIVIAVSFAADGLSWLQSMRQARKQAGEYGLAVRAYLWRASDPVVRAVVVEDSAALVGLVLAAAGLGLSEVARSNVPDAIASLLIGLLLAGTAIGLTRSLADFLVGRSVHPDQLEILYEVVASSPAVEEILSFRAVYTAPEELIVAAKVRPSGRISVEELTKAMDDLDRRLREASPLVADVFLDLTAQRDGAAPENGFV